MEGRVLLVGWASSVRANILWSRASKSLGEESTKNVRFTLFMVYHGSSGILSGSKQCPAFALLPSFPWVMIYAKTLLKSVGFKFTS